MATLLATLALPWAGPAGAAAGTFTITPTQGPPGTTVQIAGTCGFAAQTVSWGVFGSESTFHFFQPVTGPDGAFAGELVIPGSAAPGSKWPVGVTCDLSKPSKVDLGWQVFHVTNDAYTLPPPDYAFTVGQTPALIPGSWISPQSGPVGTEITITGFCGYPAQTLSYSLTYPEGAGPPIPSVVVLGEKLPTTDLGEFSVQLTVPTQGATVPQYPGPYPVMPGTHHVNVGCDYLGSGQTAELAPRDFEVVPNTAKLGDPGWATGGLRRVWFASTGVFVTAELPFATAVPAGPVAPAEPATEEDSTTATTTTTTPRDAAPTPAPPEPAPGPPPPCTAGAPTLVAPPDFFLVDAAANPPTFSWSYGDPCAAQSFVVVVTADDGAQVAGSTVTGTQWTPGRFVPGRQYFWRVAAVHDGAQGPFSATRTFVVQ